MKRNFYDNKPIKSGLPVDSEFYKGILDNLYDGVYFVDRDRVITYWNKGAEHISGYKADRVIGHSCRDNLLNHVTVDGTELCNSACPLDACMTDGKLREADVFLHHANGHRVPVIVRAAPLKDEEGNIVGAVETFSSGTGLMSVRRELSQLRRIVQTDALTALSNRAYVEGRLRALHAERQYGNSGTSAGVLFMDIDHFKQVNDTHGHKVGDRVLRMIASTLKHSLRTTDTVGRWGGEEFVALVFDVNSVTELKTICEKVRTLVELSRLDLENTALTVTISVGATLFRDSDSPESVVQRSDELMYCSKRAGRNRVTIA